MNGREINIRMKVEKWARAINGSRELKEERTARDRKQREWFVGQFKEGYLVSQQSSMLLAC